MQIRPGYEGLAVSLSMLVVAFMAIAVIKLVLGD